jgi:alanine dehydrogenase
MRGFAKPATKLMAGPPPPEGTLLLTREIIARSVPARAYVEAVREAYRQFAAGLIVLPGVGHVPGAEGAFHIKTAVRAVAPQRAVVKANGNFPGNPTRLGLPSIRGFIALLDATHGELLALMDSSEITGRRTAAASALAALLFARRESRRLALIGCGAQAGFHLDVFTDVLALESVELFDVHPDRAESFARLVQARNIRARVHDSAAAAARAAEIIVTSTPAREPVLRASDVAPGSFIAAVGADSAGKQELDAELLLRARVVPDVLTQAIHMGDLQHPVAAGLMSPSDIHAELADVIAGRSPARTDDDEIFVFDSTGTAITDLAAAELVFDAVAGDRELSRVRLGP